MFNHVTLNNFLDGYDMYKYNYPKPDITNGNLTLRINDILRVAEAGTVNFNFDEENE